jgi:hypothetical protein
MSCESALYSRDGCLLLHKQMIASTSHGVLDKCLSRHIAQLVCRTRIADRKAERWKSGSHDCAGNALCCTLLVQGRTGRAIYHLLAGAGLQPWGCQSLLVSACFQGESFGSFLAFFPALATGVSLAEGTGGSRGICCGSASSSTGCGLDSCSSKTRGGSTWSLLSWSTFIWLTPLSGSLDCNICIGCCLSGASSADGLDAHRASACEANIFIRSCRIISCCCSAIVGGSKRVWRSHCIHDAAILSMKELDNQEGTNGIC